MQVNREMMDVIEKLQRNSEDENTKEEELSPEAEAPASEEDLEALSGDEENDVADPQADVKSKEAYASEDAMVEDSSGNEVKDSSSNPEVEGKTKGARKRKEADKPSSETNNPKSKLRKTDADTLAKSGNAGKENIGSEDMLDGDKVEVPAVKSPARKGSTDKEKTTGVARSLRPRRGAQGKS